MVQRGGAGEVDAERGLTHGRTSCDDDHLSGLQALGHVVDVAESGRHALVDETLLQFVQLVERVVDHRADGGIVLTHLAHRHLVDLGLGEVNHVLGLRPLGGITELGDFGAGGDHIAQNGPLMDDFRVVHGIGGGRYGCDEAVQIVRAADLVEVAIRQQLVGHEHHVHRLTGGKQIDDRVIDRLMLGLVEIGDVNGLRDLADGILTHQHAAEHGHFRVVIVRGHAVENRVASCRRLRAAPARAVATIATIRATAEPILIRVFTSFCHSPQV